MALAKTALVLSAGGMFGAYQAGVWKSLETWFRPDIVVGASVGALNGWLIAGGYSGAELAERWLDPAAGGTLTRLGRRFDPKPLRSYGERLMAEAVPRCSFGLVVLEVPRMRTLLVRHPDVTAAHLAATCSIPVFLPSVKIGARRYVDGGFFEKLPVWAALEMGATRIVAVDSLPPFDLRWLRIGMRAVRSFAPRRTLPAGVGLTLVSPSERLGSVRDAVHWKRENVERWIRLGEQDALLQARERQIA